MRTVLIIWLLTIVTITNSQSFDWVKTAGGSYNDGGTSITTDASGNVYTIGTFSGTVDFHPGPGTSNLTSAGNLDVFIQKLDATGNFQWVRKIGGLSSETANSVKTD